MEWRDYLARLKQKIGHRRKNPPVPFNDLFVRFHTILSQNNAGLEMIAEMEDKLGGDFVFDRKYLNDAILAIETVVKRSAYNFNIITNNRYFEIFGVIEKLCKELHQEMAGQIIVPQGRIVVPLEEIDESLGEAVGAKAWNLSKVMQLPKLLVPPGFVVTVAGFRKYLAFNNLYDEINELLNSCDRGLENAELESLSHRIRLLILGGDIPPDLRREILRAAEKIAPQNQEIAFYSVRSSAVDEDGEMSFAGLHDSFLNVSHRELLSSYKKVLAGMYNPAALEYRIKRHAPCANMGMAVLYQVMVDSRSAGVVYTLDPTSPQEEFSLAAANWGLGTVVVEGSGNVDTFRISRVPPHQVLRTRISAKKRMAAPFHASQGDDVPEALINEPCLNEEEAARLEESALIIERFFKHPLDIEWSLDTDGRIWILQARPLELNQGGRARSPELKELLQHREILFENTGSIAYRGIGAGPLWMAEDNESLNRFPSGSVLVSKYSLPILARVIPRASAVITEVGSPTGHMATVAREFRVPTIVDVGTVTARLKPGEEVTVDAERKVVYRGRINELLHYQLLERACFETTYEFQLLHRLLKRIGPLNLIDPSAPDFTARNCRTLHDVMRFIHEKSVQTLARIVENPSALLTRGAKRLKADVPLNLILIDIGGGLNSSADKSIWVQPDQIASLPMQALWEGIASPDVWNTDPISADFKGLMSSLTRTRASTISGHGMTGLNMAVLGRTYLNLTLRVGYHFTVVDAVLGPAEEKNTIFFRFVGGATDIGRRSRRAALLVSIMEKYGFKVEGKSDLVIARAVDGTTEQSREHLHLIGRLIGFVRQLDILMTDDQAVDHHFERFTAGYDLSTSELKLFRRHEDER